MDNTSKAPEIKQTRKQTAQQKLNNFLRSPLAKEYPLCATLRLLLHALASYCYYKTECSPSIQSLLDYLNLTSDRHIRTLLQELEALGLISITRKMGTRSVYLWRIPEISDEEIYKKKTVHKSKVTQKKTKTPVLDSRGNPGAGQPGLDANPGAGQPTNLFLCK